MGVNQSTNRAAKFSGSTRKSIRLTQGAPASAPTVRRQLSQRNINRNVKEFSRNRHKCLFLGGSFRPKGTSGNRRSESVRRSNSVRRNRPQSAEPSRKSSRGLLTPVSTPQSTPRPMHNSYTPNGPSLPRPVAGPRNFEPSLPPPPRYDYHDDVIIDNGRARVFDSNPERLHALQFPHETAIY